MRPTARAAKAIGATDYSPINRAVTIVRPHIGVAENLARRDAYVHVHNVYSFLFKSHFNSWGAFVAGAFFVCSLCRLFDVRRTSVHVNPASIPGMFLSLNLIVRVSLDGVTCVARDLAENLVLPEQRDGDELRE
jgi:hypothetical protein